MASWLEQWLAWVWGSWVALCTGGTLAGQLKPKWSGPGVFQDASPLCHLGGMAGAIVSTDKECTVVCSAGATLLGWLRLVWIKGLGLVEVVGQLGYPDPAPIHISR